MIFLITHLLKLLIPHTCRVVVHDHSFYLGIYESTVYGLVRHMNRKATDISNGVIQTTLMILQNGVISIKVDIYGT